MTTQIISYQIEEKVKRVIGNTLGIDDLGHLRNEFTLKSLGADSLDKIEVILFLEEEFRVNFDNFQEDKDTNVGDLVRYVNSNYEGDIV